MSETNENGGATIPRVEIRITFDPASGKVEINAPLQNTVFVLGVLEMARVMVTDLKEGNKNVAQSRVVVPTFGGLPRGG